VTRAGGSIAARLLAALALGACAALAACASPSGEALPFPSDPRPDYQLGGAYPVPDGVNVVARDSSEQPADGVFSICYLNAFQSQPGEAWRDELLVQGETGPIVDPDWPDEHILDLSSAADRAAILERQKEAIAGCAADGFDAVEFDNLDSYTRSDGAFTLEEAADFATALVAVAHEHGLLAGQKNTAELGDRGRDEIGFDFAVVEECDQYDECGVFTEVYGTAMIDIEYTDELRRPFAEVCASASTPPGTILRDRDLAPAGTAGYVYERCG
jgi:hypothetical protein